MFVCTQGLFPGEISSWHKENVRGFPPRFWRKIPAFLETRATLRKHVLPSAGRNPQILRFFFFPIYTNLFCFFPLRQISAYNPASITLCLRSGAFCAGKKRAVFPATKPPRSRGNTVPLCPSHNPANLALLKEVELSNIATESSFLREASRPPAQQTGTLWDLPATVAVVPLCGRCQNRFASLSRARGVLVGFFIFFFNFSPTSLQLQC